MSSTTKALGLSFLERYTALALGIVSTMILARILTPEETGLFSLGVSLSLLVAQFRDFGVTSFLIQEVDLTDEKFRTALGLSMIASLVVVSIILLGSRFAGEFYHDPGVTHVMVVTALSFLLIPFNSIVTVCLRRQMRFNALYQMSAFGAVCHFVTGVSLALLGFSYMSLAWATLANNVGTALIAFFYRPREYSYVPSLKTWRLIAAFGVYSTIAGILQEITPRSADLFIGRTLGVASVGQFSRANGLVTLVSQSLIAAVIPVALSVFALKRRTGEVIGAAYLDTVSMLTAVAWPAFMFLAVMAFPMIRVLFGDQWDAAIEPARLVAIAAMISCLNVLHPVVYQATGAMRQRMTVQVVATPVKLTVLLVSAQFGLVAVGCGTILNAAIELGVSQIVMNRVIHTRMGELIASIWKSLLVTLASAAAPLLVLTCMPPAPGNFLPVLILSALGTGAGWLAALFLLAHPMAAEILKLLAQGQRIAMSAVARWSPLRK